MLVILERLELATVGCSWGKGSHPAQPPDLHSRENKGVNTTVLPNGVNIVLQVNA